MEANTRLFGFIDIAEDKLIKFPGGLVGFPHMTDFALIHDAEQGAGVGVQWLQSMQEEGFAIPVMNPLQILEAYNPVIEDELLLPLGEMNLEDMLVLVTVTVPSDITQMTANLKGPIVVNAANRLATQVITEGDDYQVKHPIYDILKARKGDA